MSTNRTGSLALWFVLILHATLWLCCRVAAAQSTENMIHLKSCGELTHSNATYILDNDLHSSGTCLVNRASDIVVDLNGHTIFYDEYDKAGLPNPGFENGNGDMPSDWDLTAAPTVRRRSNSVLPMYGKWHLYLGKASDGTRIVSPWTYLPASQSSAIYTVRGDKTWAYVQKPLWNLKVEFEDGSAVVNTDWEGDIPNGIIKFMSRPVEGRYRVVLTLIDSYGWQISVYGNYPSFDMFDIRPADNYGIYLSGYYNKNIVVKNGKIIQGKGKSLRGHAINVYSTQNVEIANVSFENAGVESSAISASYSDVNIYGNTVINHNPIKFNRSQISGAIYVGTPGKAVRITRNIMTECGEGWSCICLSGGSGEIGYNTVKTSSVTTNHAAILGGTIIHDNIIEADPGQGIYTAWERGGEIYNNTITIKKTAPNFEYGFYEQDAILLKDYNTKSCTGMKVHDNTITMIGDYDELFDSYMQVSAKPAYLNGIANMCSGGNTVIYNNKITARNLKPNVVITGIDPGGKFEYETLIINNTIEGDSGLLMFGGYASQGDTVSNTKFIGNTLIKSQNPSPLYSTFQSSHSGNMTTDKTHFINTKLVNGASLRDVQKTWAVQQYYVDWYLNVVAKDRANLPLANVPVTIRDKNGKEVFKGVTGQSGRIDRIVLSEFRRSGNGFKPVFAEFTPHTVSYTLPRGTAQTLSVVMDGSKVLEIRDGEAAISTSISYDTVENRPLNEVSLPVVISSEPNGKIPSEQSDATLSVKTSKEANCRYSLTPDKLFQDMAVMQDVDGFVHQVLLGVLPLSCSYNYYIKCRDTFGNTSINDYLANFTIMAGPGNDAVIPTAITSQTGYVLLNAGMESLSEINSPTVSTEKVTDWQKGAAVKEAGNGKVVYEKGVQGNAARFPGVSGNASVDAATVSFAHDNFDYTDSDNNGGKLEFWLKFNEDPHIPQGEIFLMNSDIWPGTLVLTLIGEDPYLTFEVYTNRAKSANRFLVYTAGWDKWVNWKNNEWHKVTLAWKKNEGVGNAEMHLFIDDTQAGCPQKNCNDYGGYLPETSQWKTVTIGNFYRAKSIDFSIDEFRSFSQVSAMPPLSTSIQFYSSPIPVYPACGQ